MSEQCILFLFSTTLGIGSSFSHHLGSGKEQQDIDLTSRFRKWCGSSMKSQLINSKVLLLFNNCRIESCAFTNFFLIFFCQAKWDSSCNWNSLANDGLEFFLEDTSSMRFVREWKVIWNHLKSIKHWRKLQFYENGLNFFPLQSCCHCSCCACRAVCCFDFVITCKEEDW